VIERTLGAAIALAGAALAGLAFMPWYAAGTAGVPSSASGVDASGELWSLPVLGALAIAAGLVLATRPDLRRAAGALAVAAGALGALWATRNALQVPVRLVLTEPGGPPVAVAGDLARIRAEPAAFAAIGAAACCGIAGLLALRRPARA
jgi:hypothetical protein